VVLKVKSFLKMVNASNQRNI